MRDYLEIGLRFNLDLARVEDGAEKATDLDPMASPKLSKGRSPATLERLFIPAASGADGLGATLR